MSTLAILCSGQGAQTPELFSSFPFTEKGLALKQRIIDAGCLQPEVAAWLADLSHNPEAVYLNHFSQPLICLYQAMVWTELASLLPSPAMIAGYSLGELSAYGCAGALAPADVIRLAATRAQLMDSAAGGGKLIAVTGLAISKATEVAHQNGGYLAIAISEDHGVIGCLPAVVDALAGKLRDAGAREAVILSVTVASHTPLLDSAVEPFRELLKAVAWTTPQTEVLSGGGATKVFRQDQMLQSLPEQIHHTVRWDLVQQRIVESGCQVVLELGPGKQLANMITPRGVRARSVVEFHSVDGIAAWVEKSLNG